MVLPTYKRYIFYLLYPTDFNFTIYLRDYLALAFSYQTN